MLFKKLTLLLLTLIPISLIGQVEVNYDNCNCIDQIDQVSPMLNGNYKRTCGAQIIEKGQFVNGEKEGKWETFSLKGNKIREFNYRSGQLNGDIQLFYSDGKEKLKGRFLNGKKDGSWTYFNSSGKVIKAGTFKEGKPIDNWTIYNWKGKKEMIQYDFSNNRYSLEEETLRFFKDQEIVQNDNTGEWFILFYPNQKESKGNMPIEGFGLSNDIFVNNMEIPLEIWDTFVSLNYKAKLQLEEGVLIGVELTRIDNHLEDTPQLDFIVITNQLPKLTRVKHSDLTLKLLEFKIKEALWLTGPYITTEKELEIYLPYVINEIKNRR